MATAKSRFGAFGWGPPFWEGGNKGSQASKYYYYYKQNGAHWGGVPTGDVNKGSQASKYYYYKQKGRLSTVHGSFG